MEANNGLQRQRRQSGMSYKFQRLREKIRQAVVSGELNGKLPGERELAKRFHVNAKTLSKALTDLAAEGLLQRNIGRGTFVKSSEEAAPTVERPWLLIVDRHTDRSLIADLQALNPSTHISDDAVSLRPSFLNQFSAVIDLAEQTPDVFLRDLLIRNIPVVTVGRGPRTYSTNAVLLDAALGATHLTRELVLAGHRRLLVVEPRSDATLTKAVQRSAQHYNPEVSVDPCSPDEVVCAMEFGATACICDSVQSAQATLAALKEANIDVPARFSVTAVGWSGDEYPCTGYYVASRQKATAVAEILRRGQASRPATLWLMGTLIDRGTIGSAEASVELVAIPPSLAMPSADRFISLASS